MIALIIFGPIAGVILDGYSFTFDGQRLAWIVGTVMVGRFLLSAFSATAAGRRLQARFESDNAGVYVRPPAYKSRMRWIIPLIVTLAICFPFVATKYVLTVAILGLIYVLLGLGLNI
ncbi:branched-chain amino acid ABC transporter permease, partial [Microbacterium sp. SUBG005]